MSWNNPELQSRDCIDKSSGIKFYNLLQKPIEIYAFIDPLSTECWSLEPYLKKLSVEYGQYFTIRPLIINSHFRVIENKDNNEEIQIREGNHHKNGSLYTWAAYAIKAAELQGKNAGRNFLRKLQESFFIRNENIKEKDVLIRCANAVNLDLEEFNRDFFSDSAKKALQCDYNLAKEMNVYETPTVVFFNQHIDIQGVKVTGLYPYDIYVHVLGDILQQTPKPKMKPSLEEYLAYFEIASNEEISIVFGWSPSETEKKMRKLQLKQRVIKKISKDEVFWKYNVPRA